MKNRFRRMVACLMVVWLGCLSLALPAHAGIVSSEDLVQGTARTASADRDALRAGLVALGVQPGDAAARVAALTDAEAARLAAQLDALPAGGDLIGAALIVFLVLLATDIMGYTKVFPFTRSVR